MDFRSVRVKRPSRLSRILRIACFLSVSYVYFVCADSSIAEDRSRDFILAQKLVGQWERAGHVRVFYGDGDFFIDPEPETRPVGKWAVRGGELLIWWPPGVKAPVKERILKITRNRLTLQTKSERLEFRKIDHY
jgi:hypothetical protein